MQIPIDRIHEVEIPTGLPLVFNVKKKCIQLLEDPLKELDEEYSSSAMSSDSYDPLAR